MLEINYSNPFITHAIMWDPYNLYFPVFALIFTFGNVAYEKFLLETGEQHSEICNIYAADGIVSPV